MRFLEFKDYYNRKEYSNKLDILKDMIQQYGSSSNNLVCTFTEINKVGINPQSRHDTPLGIYFYPINYVVSTNFKVPYQWDANYLQVCELTKPDQMLHMHLATSLEQQQGLKLIRPVIGEDFDRILITLNTRLVKRSIALRSNYSLLWLIAMEYSYQNSTEWNSVFRKAGIAGFIDHGTGTIHINEPVQGVVFDKSAIKLIHTIDNSTKETRSSNYVKMGAF